MNAHTRISSFSLRLPGLGLMTAFAAIALGLAALPALSHWGLGALTLAIAVGMLAAQLLPDAWHRRAAPGAQLAQRELLRAGVALYGLRLTLQDLAASGWHGVLIDVCMVALILVSAWWLGTRLLKLDRETALLVGAGSAICGAAAVMATEPVLRAEPHKVAIAVATVTIFGSCAVFLYPALFPLLGLSAQQYGVYAGSTIHEVAQVVAAGKAISATAADQAVIVKLMRVSLLAPVLAILSRLLPPAADRSSRAHTPLIPGFLYAFMACVLLESTHWLSPRWHAALLHLDDLLLALAMAALGWSARWRLLRTAGFRPLLLGAMLFLLLTLGGYAVNRVAIWL